MIAHGCLLLQIVWLGNCPPFKNSWLHYCNRLCIESLKNELSTFLCNEKCFSNLFCVFLKTNLSYKATNFATHDLHQILRSILRRCKLSVFISDLPIRISKILRATTPVVSRTFTSFFIKGKKVRSLKKFKITLYLQKNFQSNRTKFDGW